MLTDAKGLPLVVRTTPANVRDEQPAADLLTSIPPIQGLRGRRRPKPEVFQGDRGYGFPWVILAVAARHIKCLLAFRGA